MTTVVVVKCPEGLVLAADSRMTVSEKSAGRPIEHPPSDTLLKILSFKPPHNFVGAASYGVAQINQKSAHDYLPEFEHSLDKKRISVNDFADKLREFFSNKWSESSEPTCSPDSLNSMNFLVAGFDEKDDNGRVFEIKISRNIKIADKGQLLKESKKDIVLRGNLIFASRLWLGYSENLLKLLSDKITSDCVKELSAALPNLGITIHFSDDLEDAVLLAKLLIGTEIEAQALTERSELRIEATTGGPIRICTITPEQGLKWVL